MMGIPEYDLSWAEAPPWWVARIGPLRRIWENPVYQRRHSQNRVNTRFEPLRAFWVTLGISALINILPGIFYDNPNDPEFWLMIGLIVTIILPIAALVPVTCLHLLVSTLITTPIEFRKGLVTEELNPVFTTPLTDSEIYFAECLAGLLRGLRAMEEVVAVFSGLMLPFVISLAMYYIKWGWGDISGTGFLSNTIGFVEVTIGIMVTLAIVLVLISTTAGFYSVIMRVFFAIAATAVHVLIILIGLGYVIGYGLHKTLDDSSHADSAGISWVFLYWTALILSSVIMGRLGLMAFSGVRRRR